MMSKDEILTKGVSNAEKSYAILLHVIQSMLKC